MNLIHEVGKQMRYPKGFLGKVLFTWMTRMTIAHARWTIGLMDIQPGNDIIEIGFGNGANLKLLLQRAPRGSVAGVEISKTAIEMASKKNAKAISEGRLTLHQASGNALPFDTGLFDRACTIATAYVFNDPGSVFKEMHRVLKPEGKAAVTFPVRENFMKFKPVEAGGFCLHELSTLEKEFRSAGFINCRTENNDQVHFGAHCMVGEKSNSFT